MIADPCQFCHMTPDDCGHEGGGCYVMAPEMPDDHEMPEVDDECRPIHTSATSMGASTT